jgi:hypothetical protein
MTKVIYRNFMHERAKRLLYELGRLLNSGCVYDGDVEKYIPYRLTQGQRDQLREGFRLMWPAVENPELEAAPIGKRVAAARDDDAFQEFLTKHVIGGAK